MLFLYCVLSEVQWGVSEDLFDVIPPSTFTSAQKHVPSLQPGWMAISPRPPSWPDPSFQVGASNGTSYQQRCPLRAIIRITNFLILGVCCDVDGADPCKAGERRF